MSKLQRLQITSETARNELNWIPLTARRQFHKAILMFKCLRKDTEGLDMNLVRHMDIYHYNTRRKEDFVPPKPRTNQLKRPFKYSAIQTWNSLLPYGNQNLFPHLNTGTKPTQKPIISFNFELPNWLYSFNY